MAATIAWLVISTITHAWMRASHRRAQETLLAAIDRRFCSCGHNYICHAHRVDDGRYFPLSWFVIVVFPPIGAWLVTTDWLSSKFYDRETRRITERAEALAREKEIDRILKEHSL